MNKRQAYLGILVSGKSTWKVIGFFVMTALSLSVFEIHWSKLYREVSKSTAQLSYWDNIIFDSVMDFFIFSPALDDPCLMSSSLLFLCVCVSFSEG